MYASIHYINTHAPPSRIPGQPFHHHTHHHASTSASNGANPPTTAGSSPLPAAATAVNGTSPHTDPSTPAAPLQPFADGGGFEDTLRELAQDLVVKQQQIEVLARSLPGRGRSEGEQWARVRELEGELRGLEAGAGAEVEGERRRCLGVIEGALLGVRRV